MDNVNNIALTCTVTTDDTNSSTNWTLPTDTKIYYYEGVTYIAYYPYKEGISITPTQTTQDIVKSLVENNDLQPNENQNTTDGYASSDLMIATGSANASNILNVTLSLKFEHQFSLLIMTPQVGQTNLVPKTNSPNTDAGFTYRSNTKLYNVDPNAANVVFGNVTPLKMSDGSFRAIMKANTLQNLSVKYTTESNKQVFYNGSISITSGKYYTLEIKSPIPHETKVERPLKPGDFVFHGSSGIEIYPGDGALTNGKIPDYDQAVGIVVTCNPTRMTDEECNTKNWNHAYVIGFVTGDAHTWGRNQDEDFLDNCTTLNSAKDNMKGYTETNSLKDLTESFPIYGMTLVEQIRKNNPVPNGFANIRSDWFIPSVGQYYDLLNNLCGKAPDDFGTKTESS